MLRAFIALIVLLVVVGIGGFFVLRTPEIPRAQLIEKYAGAESAFLELDQGGTAHYRDQGNPEGYPLVLIHGSNASLHTWQPWADELGDAFRIISMDMPGHGLTGAVPGSTYSTADMVAFVGEVTSKLGIERFALAGNSMGGTVAWNFALSHPGKVSHLVLVDSGGLPDAGETEPPLAFKLLRRPAIARYAIQVAPPSLIEDALLASFSDDGLVTEEMIQRYADLNRMEGTRAATVRRFQNPYLTETVSRLEQITAPTLILWGDEDELISVDVAGIFDQRIPESDLIIYVGVGHIPQEEVAATSAADVRAFLAETLTPTSASPEPAPQETAAPEAAVPEALNPEGSRLSTPPDPANAASGPE